MHLPLGTLYIDINHLQMRVSLFHEWLSPSVNSLELQHVRIQNFVQKEEEMGDVGT